MLKNWIVFYISSHGFGHMTRCLAIIEELLNCSKDNIYIVCDKKQNDFARFYLAGVKDRVEFRDMQTDLGLINYPNSLTVDKAKLEKELYHFIDGWEEEAEQEFQLLRTYTVRYLICDISPIGILVGKKLGVKTIGISNFTWVEQYEGLGLDQLIIDKYRDLYSQLDYFIEYDLALPMKYLTTERSKVGFVSRRIDLNRVAEIKQKYGNSILITCGKSASLKNIEVLNYKGNIFITGGITVTGSSNVVPLPVDVMDTHNYIAACDMVFAKAGWGTIGEALVGHTRLVLIEREGVMEDTFNIEELKRRGLAISVKETDMAYMDMAVIRNEVEDKISEEELCKCRNTVDEVVKLIMVYSKEM